MGVGMVIHTAYNLCFSAEKRTILCPWRAGVLGMRSTVEINNTAPGLSRVACWLFKSQRKLKGSVRILHVFAKWVPNALLSDLKGLLEREVSYCQLLDTSVLCFGDRLGACLSFLEIWKNGRRLLTPTPSRVSDPHESGHRQENHHIQE